jgi:hypothetical protein
MGEGERASALLIPDTDKTVLDVVAPKTSAVGMPAGAGAGPVFGAPIISVVAIPESASELDSVSAPTASELDIP